jgi:regulator of protease activity HflC (stomatin/prohibitin superfamily)
MDPVNMGLALLALFASVFLSGGVHRIPEGHVGLYWRGGKLLGRMTEPGFHTNVPLIDWVEPVQTTVQTDKVLDIPCGTSGGTIIYFDRIEVVNQLERDYAWETVKNYTIYYDKTWIYDKIHHEINQFCSNKTLEEVYMTKFDTIDESLRDALTQDLAEWAPGLKIIAIRVTKPRVPKEIRDMYEAIEKEQTKTALAKETQKLVKQQAETEAERALIEARKREAVAHVDHAMMVAARENEQKLEQIANDMHLAKARAVADAKFYEGERAAAANELLLTRAYLEDRAIAAIANNTKMFFGEKLPNVFLDRSKLPGGA